MTRPLSKHRQEINDLLSQLNQEQRWRKSAEERAQREEERTKNWKANAEQNATDCDRWRRKFETAKELWNEWIEADKGLQTKEAYAVWTPETFQQLLSLLHP